MSITELKERLIQMRRLEQEALEQKRKEIEAQRALQEKELEEKRQRIERVKAAIAATRSQQRISDNVYEEMIEQVQ